MATQEKSGLWRARWAENGERKSKSGFITKKLAESYEQRQKILHQYQLASGIPKREEVLLEDLFCRYLKQASKEKRPKALKRDESSINIWKIFFRDKKKEFVHQITNQLINQDFVDWRFSRRTPRGKFPSPRTVNLDISTLRHTLLWAADFEIIRESPYSKVHLLKQKKPGLPRYLKLEEIRVIEDHMTNEGLKQAIPILLRTGMRSGELCSLDLDNINFDQSLITLRPEQTKAARGRAIPIEESVWDILWQLTEDAKKDDRRLVLCTRTGGKQTPDNLNRRFRTLLVKLGKEGLIQNQESISIHTTRKTYISHKIMKGEHPVKVMEIVGHQEWQTIKRYLCLSPEYIKNKTSLPY